MRDFFHQNDPIFFTSHIDGDCVNAHDGQMIHGTFYIWVSVKAASNASITVNGIPAVLDKSDYTFRAKIPLYGYRNTVCAIDSQNGYRAQIVLYKILEATDKYCFAVDDCIIFLYDLTREPEKYPSLFDHPLLAPFQKAHELYGACVHLNLFYAHDAEGAKDFANHKDYFDLSMMTDRYRSEFEANAHWLTLSYHANANYPDMPGMVLSPDFFRETMAKAHAEIRRFAGPASLVPVTNMHWSNSYMEIQQVFREGGYRFQFDSFRIENEEEPYLGYYGRDGLPGHIRGSGPDAYAQESARSANNPGRDLWKDNVEDIFYAGTDMVLNVTDRIPTNQIEAWLDSYLALRPNKGLVNLMIHEEYFYSDYFAYIPDCGERILKAISHVYSKGYRGAALEHLLPEHALI